MVLPSSGRSPMRKISRIQRIKTSERPADMDESSARLAKVAMFPTQTTMNEYMAPAGPPLDAVQ